jgi:hypothetical protein
MKFFEAQKRAAFAAKLFTETGFDFEAALASADVGALKAHIAGTSAPIAALFTAAGLDLPALLAAGPDSLKAHLDSVAGSDEAMAEALLENERLDGELATLALANSTLNGTVAGYTELFGTLGLAATAAPDAAAIKSAFESHIAKATTVALAKTGHPPVHHIPADAVESKPTAKSDQQKWAEYRDLKETDPAKAEAYFAEHLAKKKK